MVTRSNPRSTVAVSIADPHPRAEPIFEVQFTVCMPDYHALMPAIRIVHRTSLDPSAAWSRLTDWERHGDRVPLTRTIVETAPPTGAGTVFTARTAVAGITCDDPMEVVEWRPPAEGGDGFVRLVKRGRTVTGWAEIEVRGLPGGGSEVRWREELRVRGLPRALDPALALAGRLLFARVVRGLLRR